MMAASYVSLTRDGALGIITLNRPPVNSYHLAFVQDLAAAVEQAGRDDAIRAVVVKSALEKFFSAGADVKAFAENSHEANMQMIGAEHAVLELIERTPKIFIAMIAGHCLGGGLEIALACDLRFGGAGDFKVGLPEVTLGILPGNGGTQRLPRLVGKNRALDLMITGRTLNPQEASAIGILDRLFPMNELEQQTMTYARAVASGATLAVGSIKQAVNQGLQMPLHEALACEREITAMVFQTEDAREGIAAFGEKRKPVYKGK
jgi:enoyl-CoA hydratase/carnithine racemase